MSIRRGVIWCLVLVLAVPAAAGAQGFKWWQSDRFKADLVLSPEQIARLEEVYQGLRPTLTTGKEELDRLEARLSKTIAEGVAPEGDVMKMVDQVEHSRAELAKIPHADDLPDAPDPDRRTACEDERPARALGAGTPPDPPTAHQVAETG